MTSSDNVSSQSRQSAWWLLALALVLVSINLRPALSGVSPVLRSIRADTGLSAAAAGGLTTLPVLLFGLVAPFGTRLARRLTAERTIFFALLTLVAGILLRGAMGLTGLVAGTLVCGASIGTVMVLLPMIIKRDFASRVGLMTGLYTMALCFGAATAAGIAVPIQNLAGGSWRAVLMVWAIPAFIAAVAWTGFGPKAVDSQAQRPSMKGLWSSPLAWQVALNMGLQSVLAYCVFSWLPSILIDRGFAPVNAGAVLSVSIMTQLITSLAGPAIATRMRDQRALILLMMGLSIAGLLGCMYAPVGQIWLWAVVLGLGQGGCFSVGTMLVVLRSPNNHVVGALSGMTQLVGYTMAASGPYIAGLLHDLTGGWDATAGFFIAVGVLSMMVGWGAGRRLTVQLA
ncbi:MFS transporter, CP family, cyanate transporter [Noviherbaspirillum humi]|uniref:MFS transporter, CP family, cyanate transporter n=1 Tax=Noviherbaspirillum humi TaxID=1688639 RepID=A0A239F655_9BURK|nr:MFS transporter [Noviherbaspirillum humi]SNS52277.1 MFS transporter, CP family, cyanate transporter [Noviherbaspirillum humi]